MDVKNWRHPPKQFWSDNFVFSWQSLVWKIKLNIYFIMAKCYFKIFEINFVKFSVLVWDWEIDHIWTWDVSQKFYSRLLMTIPYCLYWFWGQQRNNLLVFVVIERGFCVRYSPNIDFYILKNYWKNFILLIHLECFLIFFPANVQKIYFHSCMYILFEWKIKPMKY